jgi:rhamnogalacturonan endolyase
MEDADRTLGAPPAREPASSESKGRSRWGEILWGDRRYWRVAWLAPPMLFILTGQGEPPVAPPARGVIALPNEEGTVTVSWRLLASDPDTVEFHVHRRDVYAGSDYEQITESPVTESTTWVDAGVRHGRSYRYRVHALIDDEEIASADTAYVTSTDWHRPYVSIALDGPYAARAVGIGDLDGDGVLDYVVKQPDFNTDPYHRERYWRRSPEPYRLEAYNGATGLLMWRYDMGWAIETGTWYSPFIVYDLDSDGFAEVYAKAGEGDPREIDGRVLEGPEYLVKIDGRTGVVVARRPWHSREGWDQYNRSQRHMLAVAYLDGENPSLIMQRGTYDLIKTAALDKNLETIWSQELRNPHELPGPGTHGLIAADVDGDGRDELILGATALDDDGSVLWETGLGHPDVCHVADIDPDNPGLEVFLGIEPRRDSSGVALLSARDGRVLWHYEGPTRHVHGKGMIGDIDPTRPGMECYAGEQDGSQFWLYAADGTRLSDQSFGTLSPFAVWWDDDPQKEILVDGRLFKYREGTERDAEGTGGNPQRTGSYPEATGAHPEATGGHPDGTGEDADGTIQRIEGRVLAIVDCIGDWREEIITSLPGELRIYTSTRPSSWRRPWLMEDRQYRLGVAAGSMGYYREPQLCGGLTP